MKFSSIFAKKKQRNGRFKKNILEIIPENRKVTLTFVHRIGDCGLSYKDCSHIRTLYLEFMVKIYLIEQKESDRIINFIYTMKKKTAIQYHKKGCKVTTEEIPQALCDV